MIETHNSTSKSLGEAVDVETDYEWDSGHPVIYAVKIIKQIAKKGQVIYDAQGKAQFGPAWKEIDVTDILSEAKIRVLADEICENAEAAVIENAAEKATARFLFNRYVDPFNTPDLAHYTETMCEALAYQSRLPTRPHA